MTQAPERELIRRIWPFALPAGIAAFALGTFAAGTDAGWSAVAAIAVVFVNFVAHGWSLALAATISPMVLYAVGLGGFVVRLGIIVAIIAVLDLQSWFVLPAFLAALVPSTIALLVFEMKLLSGRMQAEMWTFAGERSEASR
jgi:hypothetical protein